ncbi:TauD/TfdA family dioxygenase [Streptomyces sp. MNP-20]|uniref:TauD/TfdA family dioxygenase n=1 Tax=Streptomyces sp. MNP-20 TaxID=2721165 RepID=UPI002814C669|nr:TauD/TfdA family dioxygenase [Streptomyces sp. MNP-20]
MDCVKPAGRPALVQAPHTQDVAEAGAWLDSVRAPLRTALDRYGAVYLRGLPITTPQDFAALRNRLLTENAAYREKATPRTAYGDDVFSSTDLPPSQPIRLHNENSYTLTFPGILLFCCLTAPDHGGATPVADCREVLRHLPQELTERFRRQGWALTRTYDENLSLDWRTAFGTESADAVAAYCRRQRIAHSWDEHGSLRTTQRRAAVIRHPRTGDDVWFNHVAFWNAWSLDPDIRDVLTGELGPDRLPFNTSYGDGEPLTEEDIAAIHAAYDEATVWESWRPGDLMVVDNVLAAHGRQAFRGERRILVAMGDPVRLEDCRPTVPALAGLAA